MVREKKGSSKKRSEGNQDSTNKKIPELQPEKLTYRQLRQLKKRDLLQILLESEQELEYVKEQLSIEKELRQHLQENPRNQEYLSRTIGVEVEEESTQQILRDSTDPSSDASKRSRYYDPVQEETGENLSDILVSVMNTKNQRSTKKEKTKSAENIKEQRIQKKQRK